MWKLHISFQVKRHHILVSFLLYILCTVTFILILIYFISIQQRIIKYDSLSYEDSKNLIQVNSEVQKILNSAFRDFKTYKSSFSCMDKNNLLLDQVPLISQVVNRFNFSQYQQSCFVPPEGNLKQQLKQALPYYATADNYLMVTVTNFYYIEEGFFYNWISHVESLGIKNYVVGAYDEPTYFYLLSQNIPCFLLTTSLPSKLMASGYNHDQFMRQGLYRQQLIDLITELGYHQIFSELDVVWKDDPIKYMRQFPDVDLMMQPEELFESTSDDGAFEYGDALQFTLVNPGILFLRNTTSQLLKVWYQKLEQHHRQGGDPWDQGVFQTLMQNGPIIQSQNRTYEMYQKTLGKPLRVGFLNIATFPNANGFSIQHLAERSSQKVKAVHMFYVWVHQLAKRTRLQEECMWIDTDQYYSDMDTNGYISYDLHIDMDEITQAIPDVTKSGMQIFAKHFAVVHKQLQQVRNAFALATLFNRTVVLNKLWCASDQGYFPHKGTQRGSKKNYLPFECSISDVLAMERVLDRTYKESVYGPYIETRESSFLKNKRVPQEIRDSNIFLHSCWNRLNCAGLAATQQPFKELYPPQNESTLVKDLQDFQQVKVWHFTDLRGKDFFKGFQNKTRQEQFLRRMELYGSKWCCAYGEQSQDYTYYDLLYDHIPHKNRFNKSYNTDWFPTLGKQSQRDYVYMKMGQGNNMAL